MKWNDVKNAKHLLIAMAMLCLGLWGVGYWQWTVWQKNTKAFHELELHYQTMKADALKAHQLEQDWSALAGLYTNLKNQLLQVSKKAANVSAIYSLENETQVHIDSATQEPVKETFTKGSTAYQAIPFLVSATGPFNPIYNFLHKINSQSGFHQVRFVSLEKSKSKAREKDDGMVHLLLHFASLGE
jgi:Tfp pilus assembly protein PilO